MSYITLGYFRAEQRLKYLNTAVSIERYMLLNSFPAYSNVFFFVSITAANHSSEERELQPEAAHLLHGGAHAAEM